MKKLTAEKARERLAQLDQAAERCGLSLNEELLQQALQLALLVLEAQECADTVGCGFVVCQPDGTPAKVADPSKVRISFTEKGPGYAD